MKAKILLTIALLTTSLMNAQWKKTSVCSPTAPWIRCMAVDGSNIYEGDESGDVYYTNNKGGLWTLANNGLNGASIYALATSGTTIFAGTNGSGMFVSNDHGSNWTAINNGLPIGYSTYIFIYSILIDGPTIYVTTSDGVYLSIDNGSNWTPAKSGLPPGQTADAIVKCGTNLFTSIGGGLGVYISTDNAGSWTSANTGLPISSAVHLAVSGSNIFAGDQNHGVFLSQNNGNNWTRVNNNLADTAITSIAIFDTNIFVGTQHNIYLSTNNGSSWSAIGADLSGAGTYAFCISDSNVFAATDNGVWIDTLTFANNIIGTGIKKIEPFGEISISPNPFTAYTTINFDEEQNNSIITIMDIYGNIIKTNNFTGKQMILQKEDLNVGIYFVQIIDKDKSVSTKKIVVQ